MTRAAANTIPHALKVMTDRARGTLPYHGAGTNYSQDVPGSRQGGGSSGGSRPPSSNARSPSASGRRTATRVGGLLGHV